MVNTTFGINWPKDLKQAMEPTLTHVDGWVAMGEKIKKPRTGWYAQKEYASFTITVPDIETETNFLTILSMQSYGPTFVDSLLQVDVTVLHADRNGKHTRDRFEIEGYHVFKSSVHYPFKFQLEEGANPGDTIILEARLIGGSMFKIAGIMLCAE